MSERKGSVEPSSEQVMPERREALLKAWGYSVPMAGVKYYMFIDGEKVKQVKRTAKKKQGAPSGIQVEQS